MTSGSLRLGSWFWHSRLRACREADRPACSRAFGDRRIVDTSLSSRRQVPLLRLAGSRGTRVGNEPRGWIARCNAMHTRAKASRPMIPYFEQPSVSLGPITIYAFGVLLALAIAVGLWIFHWHVRRARLDGELASRLATWTLAGGLVGAHLFDRLLYHPAETLARPQSLLFLWEGLSSYGGLFGGLVALGLFFRRTPQGTNTYRYLDAVASAVPYAWFLGRVGCSLAYDHPGTPTSSFLGEAYVDGIVRHNLGLEEALYWLALPPRRRARRAPRAAAGRRARDRRHAVRTRALRVGLLADRRRVLRRTPRQSVGVARAVRVRPLAARRSTGRPSARGRARADPQLARRERRR